ncbi:hypothetical protein QE152_g23547 [Popillia japonica]|uniref:G-protein coupled receptors family 1 profile domain-containing protein n=1 Tax=Popillia japonica TaxID=7064 RepID=A0AAW1KF80_POPJA
MELFPEVLLISSGFIGIISNIITFLVILISRRTTPTYIYIMYAALLMILEQCFVVNRIKEHIKLTCLNVLINTFFKTCLNPRLTLNRKLY